MSFMSPRNRPARPPREARTVLAVGQRVFVNSGSADGMRSVAFTDGHGAPTSGGLRDGVEVEVLAWRPRGSAGTRYRVRDRLDGADGWLAADELRTTAVRPAPAPSAAVAAPSSDMAGAGRPFGSRA